MAAAPLPPAFEERLRDLESRARRWWIIGGACRFTLALLAMIAAVLALDAACHFSSATRCLLEIGGAAFLGILAWQFLWKPSQEELSLFVEDLPFPRTSILLAFTLIVSFASLAVAASLPGMGERLRRAALPWHHPIAILPFDIVVTSGDPIIRRGDSITLAAYLRPRDSSAILPESASLVLREGSEGSESALPMTGDSTGTFHYTRPGANEDFEYRIEAGPAVSEWHAVRVADSVELTERSRITIVPPAYAASLPNQVLARFTELEALQYSTARLELGFNRPAESAFLEWRPDGRTPLEAPDQIPIALAPDRISGDASFRIRTNGVLRIILLNEAGPRKLRSETMVNVRTILDAPPRFERIAGMPPQPILVPPGATFPIEFSAVDDFGIAAAELEYAIGPSDAPIQRLPIPLVGVNTPHAAGRYLFDLSGKGNEGDSLRFRLRARDTRQVDDAKLAPQEATFPDGWAEIRFSPSAPPRDQQEIFGQRDSLRDILNAAIQDLKTSQGETESLETDTADQSPLPIDQVVRLTSLRDRLRSTRTRLEAAARNLTLAPEMRTLADGIRESAEGLLAEADDSLRRGVSDIASDRVAALGMALIKLRDAAERIERLSKQNERLAQNRLDSRRLATLAADQSSLADRAKQLLREEVLKHQRELLDRLKRLLANSVPLQRGVEAAAARQAANLTADIHEQAAALRDLDALANRASAALRQSLLDSVAAEQTRFVQRADKLHPMLETPTRLTAVAAPRREDFQRVAEMIQQDRLVKALTVLEQYAQALDRLAAEFETWTAERSDAKLTVVQFAKWQDDLRGRFLTAIQRMPFDTIPEAQKLAFRSEQEALLKSAERLKLPADPAAGNLREAALMNLRQANKLLAANGLGGDEAMKHAVEALLRLSEKLPGAAERIVRSRPQLEKLRIEQDAIIAAADPVFRVYEKHVPTLGVVQTLMGKLGAFQPRQLKLGDRLAGLDLPGLEARQARAVLAAKAAAADLRDGLLSDATASLAWSKRELERLRQAVDNQPPIDERTEEFALKQWKAARMFVALGEQPTNRQLEPVMALQLEVLRFTESIAAPDAPETPLLLEEVRAAAKAAEMCLRDGSKRERVLQRMFEAAECMKVFADRLNDRESDRDRVHRLAANRRQAVCRAKQHAGRPPSVESSEEMRRELKNELVELAATRAGAAGQLLRRKAFDAYTKLLARPEPDRLAGEQKQLAELLMELAESMQAAELNTRPVPPSLPPELFAPYLPSKRLADDIRDLAREQRERRERINGLSAEIAIRSKPAEGNAFTEFEERQLGLAESLSELARRVDLSATAAANASATKALAQAAGWIRQAERKLIDAAKKQSEGLPAEAGKLRLDAESLLREAAETAASAAPPVKETLDSQEIAAGEAINKADRAMRKALGESTPPGEVSGAMRRAIEELNRAAKSCLAAEPQRR